MSLATLLETSMAVLAVLLEGLRHVRRDAKFYFAGSSGVKWGLNQTCRSSFLVYYHIFYH